MLVIGYRPFMAKSTKSTPAEPDVPVEAESVPSEQVDPVEPEVPVEPVEPVPEVVADEQPVEPEVDRTLDEVKADHAEGAVRLTREQFDAEFARYRQMGLDEREREVEVLGLELADVRERLAKADEVREQEVADVRQAALERAAVHERELMAAREVPGRAETLLAVSADTVELSLRPSHFRATAIELRELAGKLLDRASFMELEARYAERELGR